MSGHLQPIDVVEAFAHLGERWLKICDRPRYGQRMLATAGLKRYLVSLRTLSQPDTPQLLLPCNFETYASCVAALLQELINFKPSKIVEISTLLSIGLKRWYNICEEYELAHPLVVYTRDDWEVYKDNTNAIAHLQSSQTQRSDQGASAEPNIQIRRIVAPFHWSDVETLYLYKAAQRHGVPVADAKYIINGSVPECMEVLPEIRRTVEVKHGNYPVHILATHNKRKCGPAGCKGAVGGWEKVVDHFVKEYHTDRHRGAEPISGITRGVFCAFVEMGDRDVQDHYKNVPRYDDTFVVDMNSVNAGVFGVAFYREWRRDLSGMIILDDHEVEQQRDKLKGLWERPSD